MISAFAYTTSLAGHIVLLVFFSIFVQAAEGFTYEIVTYVKSISHTILYNISLVQI